MCPAALLLLALAGCSPSEGPSAARSSVAPVGSGASTAVAGATERWVTVPAGSAQIGSPEDEKCRATDEPRRTVGLTRSFAIQATEVTRRQFGELMGYDPSGAPACGDECPVDSVSWHEAVAYCAALSRRQELAACYRCTGARAGLRCVEVVEPVVACQGYRLPTEAEWEVAARAGSEDTFAGGDIASCMTRDDVTHELGWYKGNSGGTTHPVAQKKANPFGLYDMHGNIAEWTGDWYEAQLPDEQTDPQGPPRGTERVFRGGDWYHNASHARAAHRERFRPDKRLGYVGFRCVVAQ